MFLLTNPDLHHGLLSNHCLTFFPKKFKGDVADDRGYRGDFKIGSGKNISDCPSYAPLFLHARALKFSHQKIGIKQENDKTYLDDRLPNTFLLVKYLILSCYD